MEGKGNYTLPVGCPSRLLSKREVWLPVDGFLSLNKMPPIMGQGWSGRIAFLAAGALGKGTGQVGPPNTRMLETGVTSVVVLTWGNEDCHSSLPWWFETGLLWI